MMDDFIIIRPMSESLHDYWETLAEPISFEDLRARVNTRPSDAIHQILNKIIRHRWFLQTLTMLIIRGLVVRGLVVRAK